MKGKLIVIDGADGAGKATQVGLLVARLQQDGYAVESLDFPRYTHNTFGKLLRKCLDGHHGDFMQVDARIASTLYAVDRFESKKHLEEWLAAGKIVVLDRYVSANMMHQGAKIHDEAEIESFLEWLDHIEHELFAIPRPDKIVYLDVPHTVRERMKAEAVAAGKHGAQKDLAEMDTAHQIAAELRARQIVQSKNNWQLVECCLDEELRSRESIHDDIYQAVLEIVSQPA